MGSDIASLPFDNKPDVLKVRSNGVSCGTNRVSPKPSGESVNVRRTNAEEGSHVERSPEKQDAVGVKSTNYESISPGGVTPKPEPSKSSEKTLGSPVIPVSGSASLEENVAAGLRISSNTNSFHSPMKTKQSQVVMGPRWKGKGSEVKALANPISRSILDLKLSLSRSNSKGILSGCSVRLACNPEQTNLLNQTCFGRPEMTVDKDQWFQFTLEEAFYLYFSLKCIKIVGGDNSIKTNNDVWEYMTSKKVAFPDVYKAYSHLRDKNWVVRSGCQYGVDFVAYRHHPSLVHSEYAVLVFSEGKVDGNDRLRVWSDFQSMLRLCGSVAKTLLVLHVNRNGEKVIASSPSCLDGYSVEERTITRWSAERCREDQAVGTK